MPRPLAYLLLSLWTLCLCGEPAHAAKVKTWQQHTPAHFEKGQLKQTVVSSEGTVTLARRLEPLAKIDATHVWSVVEDKAGHLFAATGDEGKVFKIYPDGKRTLVYTSPDCLVLSLAVGDGCIYAGTGPEGSVVRIPAKGKPHVVADHLGYVWSLAYDKDRKVLYAGTGPKGRIHQIDADGCSVFYQTKQNHVLCVALGEGGTLYAGTDKGGLVYKIDRKGKGFVLYQTTQGEVRSLLVSGATVYAGTSAPTTRHPGQGSTIAKAGKSPKAGSNRAKKKPADKAVTTSTPHGMVESSSASKDKEKDSDEDSKGASSAPAVAGAGENALYRIASDGGVRELFHEKAMLLSLLKCNGRLLVGTGMNGQLFEIDEETRERRELARVGQGQIHCLLQRADGSIVLGTGDTGGLLTLQYKYVASGRLLSEILDAKLVSRWGTVSWKAATRPGTKITLAVRSGNVGIPDETWSDWSAELTNAEGAQIAVPSARFLQYRATLTRPQALATPELSGVTVRYQTTNQAPEVTSLEVPDLDAASVDNPKKLKLRWTAVDPNEDELAYSLYLRKEGWETWILIEDKLTKTHFDWDTTGIPSGRYQVKVIASDRPDNSAEDTLKAERVSAPFPVSHEPPVVTVAITMCCDGSYAFAATARDPHCRLTEAAYSINGKDWHPLFPSDGLFDRKSVEFHGGVKGVRGPLVLMVRVRNSAGVYGTADVQHDGSPFGFY